MNDYIAIVYHYPPFPRFAFPAAFLFVLLLGALQYIFGQGIQHTVAGAVADDEIIGEGGNVLDVEQEDVFTLFLFQGAYDEAG